MDAQRILFAEPNTLCSKMGLRPLTLGKHFDTASENRIVQRVLPWYQIVCVLRGNYVFASAFTEEQQYSSDAVILTFPGVWHHYRPAPGETMVSFSFIFEGYLPERYQEEQVITPARPIFHPNDSKRFLKHCKRIWQRGRSDPVSKTARRLTGILQELVEQGFKSEPAELKEVQRITDAMRNQVSDPSFDFESYCSKYGLGFEAWRKKFKTATGCSPGHYFSQLKVVRAKELLMETTLSVKLIAHSLGFADPYYFSRWFRKQTRLSPTRYRSLVPFKLRSNNSKHVIIAGNGDESSHT